MSKFQFCSCLKNYFGFLVTRTNFEPNWQNWSNWSKIGPNCSKFGQVKIKSFLGHHAALKTLIEYWRIVPGWITVKSVYCILMIFYNIILFKFKLKCDKIYKELQCFLDKVLFKCLSGLLKIKFSLNLTLYRLLSFFDYNRKYFLRFSSKIFKL